MLLPLPLGPIRPSVSPSSTSKLTSRTAQSTRRGDGAAPAPGRHTLSTRSPNLRLRVTCWPILNFFDTFSNRMDFIVAWTTLSCPDEVGPRNPFRGQLHPLSQIESRPVAESLAGLVGADTGPVLEQIEVGLIGNPQRFLSIVGDRLPQRLSEGVARKPGDQRQFAQPLVLL